MQQLLYPSWQLTAVAKNLYTAVLAFDPSTRDALEAVHVAGLMLRQGYPVRVAFVLGESVRNDATGEARKDDAEWWRQLSEDGASERFFEGGTKEAAEDFAEVPPMPKGASKNAAAPGRALAALGSMARAARGPRNAWSFLQNLARRPGGRSTLQEDGAGSFRRTARASGGRRRRRRRGSRPKRVLVTVQKTPVRTEYPRRGRGAAATPSPRTIRVAAAAPPRLRLRGIPASRPRRRRDSVSAEYPRRGRGAAATLSPRTIRVAAAAPPRLRLHGPCASRLIFAEYPRRATAAIRQRNIRATGRFASACSMQATRLYETGETPTYASAVEAYAGAVTMDELEGPSAPDVYATASASAAAKDAWRLLEGDATFAGVSAAAEAVGASKQYAVSKGFGDFAGHTAERRRIGPSSVRSSRVGPAAGGFT